MNPTFGLACSETCAYGNCKVLPARCFLQGASCKVLPARCFPKSASISLATSNAAFTQIRHNRAAVEVCESIHCRAVKPAFCHAAWKTIFPADR
jgi:hypothetical protein